MKNKVLACVLCFLLISTLGLSTLSYADSVSDKQNELDSVNQQKQDVKNDMQSLLGSIEAQQKEVDEIQAELNEKQAQVDRTLAEITEIKSDIEARKDGLNQRLRTMYKNGSVGYLDVLLGSSSLSEFLSNVEMIQRIYKNDQKTLTTLKTQYEEIEEKQNILLKEKEDISAKKAVADEKNAELKSRKAELQAQLDSLDADAQRISGEIASLQKPDMEYTGGQFLWPTNTTYVTSPFGFRVHPVTGIWSGHTGIDIGCGMNSPVYASASGTVIIAQWYGGYGNAVVIDHGSGLSTLYGHNNELLVSPGQTVTQGQVIARSGTTGISTGPHLHFEIREFGNYVDPMKYF